MVDSALARDVERLEKSLGELPLPTVRPAFVVVSGLPGTGKSHFCRRLAERSPLTILESDALRKVLIPSPTYSPEESARLFQVIHLLIEKLLKRGIPLVLDATNLLEHNREQLYHIADRVGAKMILVWVQAPPDVVRQRLEGRRAGASPVDHSEAGWGVYQKMRPTAEKIGRNYFAVDTSRDITPVIEKILREIRR